MFEFTIRQIWNAINNAYRVTLGTESLGFMTVVVGVHIFLAIATLGLGDKTICDILRPIKKIFKPDADSILDGVFEITVGIPRAIIYYVTLYIRSYFLALRIVFWLVVSIFFALLTLLAFTIAMGFVYGFNTPLSEIGAAAQLINLSFFLSLAYWYWRFDGHQIVLNIKRAWDC